MRGNYNCMLTALAKMFSFRIPVRTIFEPHPEGGVVALSLTPDSKYLASLSAGYRGQAQALAIWDWTMEDDTPLCTATLSPSFGQQVFDYIFTQMFCKHML